MNTRPLTEDESDNLKALNNAGCNSALIFITDTGLRKAILDATEPVRHLLRATGLHDYSQQTQGQNSKVILLGAVITDAESLEISISLYRPETKKGDPRIWFQEFRRFAFPNDVCAIFVVHGKIHILNLTRTNLAELSKGNPHSWIMVFFRELESAKNIVATELVMRLRELAAAGPLESVCAGDTGIGRSIETALGIAINSSKNPDYKGIELKSGRSTIMSRETRATLFGCVPDWKLSNLKSSREILERFGYQRGNDFKLYCTVSTVRANSQGLQLSVESAESFLREFATKNAEPEVCMWSLQHLHDRLSHKHQETFWIKAKAVKKGAKEFFHLESTIHTTRPSVEQFDRLLDVGSITLDHLIKRKANGRISEKGPLFKIERQRLNELFLGEPKTYSLTT